MAVWNDAAVSDYGKRLRALRAMHGLGPYQAAKKIGVTHETLKDAEEGAHQPQQRTRQKIGAFYGVDPDTLAPTSERALALRPPLTIDRVSPTHTGEAQDSTLGEGPDVSDRRVLEAIALLVSLPPEARAAAISLVQHLAVQGPEGKAERLKEGSG